ncbi:TIM barrel protein [Devriesea agamarum]|uniref:TIM barrel protein n=1 Tax=Devriesea agamarum TaxID=472569 RepID=UPI00071D20F8|nr:TIM barrel protein [Devriesea agamarum]
MSTTMENKDSLRLAAAPISWGVCEAANWGYQLDADRVFGDMARLGVKATEFGPYGYLPTDPAERAAYLDKLGMTAIGGFFPMVLHKPDVDPFPALEAELDAYEAAGASVLVVSVDSGEVSYDAKREMNDEEWKLCAERLNEVRERAAARGVRAVVHQHVGTMIESPLAVQRLVDDTDIELCLDTGHMICGGNDPYAFVRDHADRVGHVHLKDVDLDKAGQVARGELAFSDAVATGVFLPLGTGGSRIAEIIRALQEAGYDGWYVMEQDCKFDDPAQGDAALADVTASVEFLRSL